MTDMDQPVPGSSGAKKRIEDRFDLIWNRVDFGPVNLLLPELKDPISYIQKCMEEKGSTADDLPFWTNLWPAAIVLASFASRLPQNGEPILELGAGLGLPGLAAAASGNDVVITDLEPDALEFARAAAEANGLEDKIDVRALDWTKPPADLGRFKTILGAEVLYQPKIYTTLVDLLETLTEPDSSVFLSHQIRPFVPAFFQLAQERFGIKNTKRTIRSEDGPVDVILYALKPRSAKLN